MGYIELIENGKLFVLCKKTVRDALGVYCKKGKEYEVIDMGNNDNFIECFLILTEDEDMEMKIRIDDKDFEVVVK